MLDAAGLVISKRRTGAGKAIAHQRATPANPSPFSNQCVANDRRASTLYVELDIFAQSAARPPYVRGKAGRVGPDAGSVADPLRRLHFALHCDGIVRECFCGRRTDVTG